MDTDTAFTPTPSWKDRVRHIVRTYGRHIAIGVGILLIIIIGLWLLACRSLPGDALYGLKTGVFESIGSSLRVTASSRAAYETKLLERRLEEIDAFRFDTATTSPEILASVATLVGEETDAALHALEGSSLAPEKQIALKLHIASITDAHDVLARSGEEFAPMEEMVGPARSRALTSMSDDARTFASSSPSEAATYMGTELETLKGELEVVADGSRAERVALERLSDATDAIMDGAFDEALVYILRARQAIAVDRYLWESERGPVEGAAPAPGPIPEGS